MPHYYFHIFQRGAAVPDFEGMDFEDLEAARFEAKASARDLARYALNEGAPLDATCVEIRDSENNTLASITVEEVLKHPNTPRFGDGCDFRPSAPASVTRLSDYRRP
jgi:hypothetical protein